jgi:hypothetical protein
MLGIMILGVFLGVTSMVGVVVLIVATIIFGIIAFSFTRSALL